MSSLDLHASWEGKSLPDILKAGGLVGCGGAGFPTWGKYSEVHPYHLTNAQESEPGYYIDKWHHKVFADEYVALYHWLLEWGVKKIIIAPKTKDKAWFEPLEKKLNAEILDCTGRNRHNPDDFDNPFLFTYTDDRYAFGKEGALLLVSAQVKLKPGEFPGQHGWVVNNSQTMHNMFRVMTAARPVTEKYVHVYGECKHIFKKTPIGTTATDLFAAAGTSLDEIESKGLVVVEGGPGWYHKIDPKTFSVTRRTNSLLVIDPAYRDPDGKDVLAKGSKPGYPRDDESEHEKEPSGDLEPGRVVMSLQDNPEMTAVTPAVPKVDVGATVEVGEVIASAGEGFSVPVHASIPGKISGVSAQGIEIER
jgi:Na+-translocating ferredoxin:NAD+ oxidoreductase RnfC subunit